MQTKAIGLYVEEVKDGRRMFELLRSADTIKPLVILKGGQTQLGALAANSHTGALAEKSRVWTALCRQSCSTLVETVDEFIDTLLALQHLNLHPNPTSKQVTLFGNGGGASVLGVDAFSALGLEVAPFEGIAKAKLQAMQLPAGTSISNPIDTPVATLLEQDGWVAAEILDIIFLYARPDIVVMHLNLAAFVGRGHADPVDKLFKVIEHTLSKWKDAAHFVLVLRSDGSEEIDGQKRQLRETAFTFDIPVFDEIAPMAKVLSNISHFEHQLFKLT